MKPFARTLALIFSCLLLAAGLAQAAHAGPASGIEKIAFLEQFRRPGDDRRTDPEAANLLDRSLLALKGGSAKKGRELFLQAAQRDAAGMLLSGDWYRLTPNQVSYHDQGEVFHAAYGELQDSLYFWAAFCHTALAAGQPEQAVKGAENLYRIVSSGNYAKPMAEKAKQAMYLFSAAAFCANADYTNGYNILLNAAGADLDYMQNHLPSLLKDADRFARVMKIGRDKITARFRVVPREFFRDPKSGKLLGKTGKVKDAEKKEPVPGVYALSDLAGAMNWPSGKEIAFAEDYMTVVILDSGFKGLHTWLASHPEEQRLTRYKILIDDKKPGEADHGYLMYRIVRQILPHVKIYCMEEERYGDDVETLKVVAKANYHYVIWSKGGGRISSKKPGFQSDLTKLLKKYNIFLFTSAGNERMTTHYFEYADRDGDGWLEFRDQSESLRFYAEKGGGRQLHVSWNEYPAVSSLGFQVTHVPSGKEVFNDHLTEGNSLKQALAFILFNTPETGWYELKIRGLDVKNSDTLKFRVTGKNITATWNNFNGLESANFEGQLDSPFIIPVGAFGRLGDKGWVMPLPDSSIGTTDGGRLVPEVLAPGKFELDGRTVHGTSFATPALGAVLANFAGYNVKNLLEYTSDTRRFGGKYRDYELGMYGIPDFSKLLKIMPKMTRIYDLSHQRHEKTLSVTLTMDRYCMEGLDYYVWVTFKGLENGKQQILTAPNTSEKKPFNGKSGGLRTFRNAPKHIRKKTITIDVPLDRFRPQHWGQELDLVVKVATRLGRFDEEKVNYRLTLEK